MQGRLCLSMKNDGRSHGDEGENALHSLQLEADSITETLISLKLLSSTASVLMGLCGQCDPTRRPGSGGGAVPG